MPEMRVEEAAAVPWADVEHSLTGGGEGGTCWCQWFTLPRKEFAAADRDELRTLLRREVRGTRPSPGLVAYVDDEAAGWVRVSPRAGQPTLLRSRVVATGSDEPLDAADVWAITCLVVRREFRGMGVAGRLVDAGVEHAAAHGARAIEAYPFDTARSPRRANELFVGTVGLFGARGFETARPTQARVVMTRDLAARS
jgi:ribosomal protein S18 acetylase RimI-like enzyme